MNHITKQFGAFKANDDVTLHIREGEIHALLGENGAGKSTLMSVLFGLYQPESGEILVRGKREMIKTPSTATRLGIGMVHQHFKLVHNFTVLESIMLGRETTKAGVLEMEAAEQKIRSLSEKYQFHLDPHAKIADLTVGMQQKVEILKVLYTESDILIFDEPTAMLIPQEIDELIKIMRRLIQEGKSIVFITHKLAEIKAVANRCSVLRKGKFIGTVEVSDVTKEQLSEMMVGRKIKLTVEKKPREQGEAVLAVENLTIKSRRSKKNLVDNVSFDVHKGEVLCLAGIDGNGQSELVYGITGLLPIDAGQITYQGQDVTKASVRQKCLAGFAHIPEDRHKYGLVLDFTLKENLVLQTYYSKKFHKNGFIKFHAVRRYAQKLIEQFDIRSSMGADSTVRSMSGGNQQKAIIARELDRNPALIVAVQPVRGLDVGAIEYIHEQIIAQRDAGKAVLLVSLELDEVMNLSDRILVMHEGKIVAEVDPKTISLQQLGIYMAGTKGESKQ